MRTGRSGRSSGKEVTTVAHDKNTRRIKRVSALLAFVSSILDLTGAPQWSRDEISAAA
jgi:hypothetical protein